eukprot:1207427-Amphidinium_carterae.3
MVVVFMPVAYGFTWPAFVEQSEYYEAIDWRYSLVLQVLYLQATRNYLLPTKDGNIGSLVVIL